MIKHQKQRRIKKVPLPDPAENGKKYSRLAVSVTTSKHSNADRDFMYRLGYMLETNIGGLADLDASTAAISGNCVEAAMSQYLNVDKSQVAYILVSPKIENAELIIHIVDEVKEMFDIDLDLAMLASYYALVITKYKSILYLSPEYSDTKILSEIRGGIGGGQKC